MEKSKFLKVMCPRCKLDSTVYGKAATKIKCQNCNKQLAKTTGGKTRILARIKEILWN